MTKNIGQLPARQQDGDLATDISALAVQINEHHRQCQATMNAGLEHAIKAGQLLLVAKKQCPHGEWLPWLETNFEGSERTAQAYMRIASQLPKLAGNAQRVADLTFRGALAAVASNSQVIAAKPPKEQRAALVAWDEFNCKNAHQALCRAERKRAEKRCATAYIVQLPARREPSPPPDDVPERRYEVEEEAHELYRQLCEYFAEWPPEHRCKIALVVQRVAALLEQQQPTGNGTEAQP